MKKLYFILTIPFIFNLLSCSSEGKKNGQQVETAVVKVNTVVCGMCADKVKKALGALDGVENVKVDLEKKTATVRYLPARVDLLSIEKSIAQAGYDANEVKADPDAYEKLDACCKVEG